MSTSPLSWPLSPGIIGAMASLYPSQEELEALSACALGEAPVDLCLKGSVLDVYTGEVLPDRLIGVKGRWIAFVGREEDLDLGGNAEVLDLKGLLLIPGMIDAHAHLGTYGRPDLMLEAAIPTGTTTVITEMIDIVFKVGYEGLLLFMEALSHQPIKVFFTLPSLVTLSPSSKRRAPSPEELLCLLEREDVLGLGEAYWQEVVRERSPYAYLTSRVLAAQKRVEGHTAGAKGGKLQAYLALGASSCHEPITAEDALERLRLGLHVMVREGSVRRDLEEVLKVKDKGVDLRRLVLVSDGLDPDDLVAFGWMDYLCQKAIDLGLDPVKAIQMVTLNPAEHFGIDPFLGGIAPLRRADIVAVEGLRAIKPKWVIADGRVLLEEGVVKAKGFGFPYPRNRFLRGPLSPGDLRPAVSPPVRARVVQLVTDLVTKEEVLELGDLEADPSKDLAKLVFATEDRVMVALIKGTGLKKGAMATSSVWEAYGITAVGIADGDICVAVNRVLELGGGICLVEGGRVLGELPLPLGSAFSDLPLEEVVLRLKTLKEGARALGFRSQNPLRTLETLTTPAIPFLRVSEEGLVDLKRGKVLPPFEALG